MKPIEIYEDISAAYDEAIELLRSRKDELDASYRLYVAGKLSDYLFQDAIGFSARTAAFSVSDSLRRLGEGIGENLHPDAEAK